MSSSKPTTIDMESDKKLVVVAGFDVKHFDDETIKMLAKEIKAHTPKIFRSLAIKTGWGWWLSVAGLVTTYQSDAQSTYQTLAIYCDESEFTFTGEVFRHA